MFIRSLLTMVVAWSAILVCLPRPVVAQQVLARVGAVQRVTEKRSGNGPWRRVGRGATLVAGDRFRTGKRSKADLRFSDGSLLRLGQLSSLQLRGGKEVALTGGRLLFSQLQPGRVVAGTAAAAIKGSAGIVELKSDGGSDFTLFLGSMDVETAGATVTLTPGQAISAAANGVLSPVRVAPPFGFNDGEFGSEFLEIPNDAPFAGSRDDEIARNTSIRRALDQLPAQRSRLARDFGSERASPFPTPFPTSPGAFSLSDRTPFASDSKRKGKHSIPGAAPMSLLESRRLLAQVAAPPIGAPEIPPVSVPPPTVDAILDLNPAYRHLEEIELDQGRALGGDAALLGALGEGGTAAYGAQLHGFGARGQLFFDLSLQPLRVRGERNVFGERTLDYSSISGALLAYRNRDLEVRVGRQRFLRGPMRAAFFGSLVRQGGHDIMDALRVSSDVGGGRLDVAYIHDAFVRNLPFRSGGAQHAFYGRFDWSRRGGNVGVNLLKYTDARDSDNLGATIDFAFPIGRDAVELYGEVGRDTARRRLTSFGLTFPSLYQKSDFDVYLEYARLGSSSQSGAPPSELAARVYRRIGRDLNIVLAANRFSNAENNFTIGLSYGGRGEDGRR